MDNTFFEENYEKVEELTKSIKSVCTCSACGGGVSRGMCNYCAETYPEQIESTKQLQELLSTYEGSLDNMEYNEFMNRINELSSQNIPIVNEFLEKSNYNQVLENAHLELAEKLKNNTPLDATDINKYEYLTFNYVSDEEKFSMCDNVIMNSLLKNQQFSYPYFEEVVQEFTETLMSQYVKDPKCEIVNQSDLSDEKEEELRVAGGQSINSINLSEETVSNIYIMVI